MRKYVGLLCAAALMAPVGVIATAGPAAAAPVVKCTKASGTFKFSPPLPLASKPKIKTTLSSKGTVKSCTGSGGVKSGATVFKANPPTTKSNCSNLANPSTTGTKGTFTITWNNGKKSVVTKKFTVKQGTGANIATATTTGKITSGLFVGKPIKGSITFALAAGSCSTKPASGGTYKQKTNFTIG
jgi:hypothetical protein